jgi:meiotically up-regulated gene 157 (Mug157) protein
MLYSYLSKISVLLGNMGENGTAERATKLANQIQKGIQTFGVVKHPQFGPIYAYEVDG